MNDLLNQWLAARATAPGMLACGVRLPDRACLCHSFSETCPRENLEKILHQLAYTQSSLANDGFAPRWSTWTFERGLVRLVLRPDGVLLGLVVQSGAEAAPNPDPLSEEFLALNLAG